ncbi:hypothetical protein EVA_22774, partial [gut metagenome]
MDMVQEVSEPVLEIYSIDTAALHDGIHYCCILGGIVVPTEEIVF